MYFSDRATLRRWREDPDTRGELGQPTRTQQEDEPIWCRAWPNREGHRENIAAMTDDADTIRAEGFSIAVPRGTDVQEEDLITSLIVESDEWLTGSLSVIVRAIGKHRRYRELFSPR